MQPIDGKTCGLPVLPPTPADAALKGDAAEFSQILSDLIRSYRLRENEEVCSFGITLTECYGLEVLVFESPLTVNEFADVLGIDKSTASRAVFSLERKGLARRRPHPDDGRALQLLASPLGARLYRSIRRSTEDCHRRLLSTLDPATRRALNELLRRLVRTTGRGVRAARRSA